MSNLITTNEKKNTINSREVAEMIGKEHSNLMRDVKGYIDILNSPDSKLNSAHFFIESNYIDKQNQLRPCYQITKKGCEFIGNKLTGKKGILFTAAYVTKFNEMEQQQVICMEDVLIAQLQEMKSLKQTVLTTKKEVKEVDTRVEHLENTMTIDYSQQETLRELANRRVLEVLGGKGSGAYKQIRNHAFAEMWRNYKRKLQVNSYKNTATKDFDKGKEVIQGWMPDKELGLMITGANVG